MIQQYWDNVSSLINKLIPAPVQKDIKNLSTRTTYSQLNQTVPKTSELCTHFSQAVNHQELEIFYPSNYCRSATKNLL
ncbi:hypothetical protein XELAEV_18033030mg [Xenopus laevis]|uniref:Uncharacterized protein n=1 Tax=Xenopus laevis TaxID=8355 RepID=A0A974CKW4_XENLA|nr:hypothetical protein XELAEV_18033030mg [Xenopus laevis]